MLYCCYCWQVYLPVVTWKIIYTYYNICHYAHMRKVEAYARSIFWSSWQSVFQKFVCLFLPIFNDEFLNRPSSRVANFPGLNFFFALSVSPYISKLYFVTFAFPNTVMANEKLSDFQRSQSYSNQPITSSLYLNFNIISFLKFKCITNYSWVKFHHFSSFI